MGVAGERPLVKGAASPVAVAHHAHGQVRDARAAQVSVRTDAGVVLPVPHQSQLRAGEAVVVNAVGLVRYMIAVSAVQGVHRAAATAAAAANRFIRAIEIPVKRHVQQVVRIHEGTRPVGDGRPAGAVMRRFVCAPCPQNKLAFAGKDNGFLHVGEC